LFLFLSLLISDLERSEDSPDGKEHKAPSPGVSISDYRLR